MQNKGDFMLMSFNSQPPEGGWNIGGVMRKCGGGFNSQPPEGGWLAKKINTDYANSFNSQPPEGGWKMGW